MCITNEKLEEMEKRLMEAIAEVEKKMIQGDKETYHRMSSLVHTMSPQTRTEIEEIKTNLRTHTEKEEGYWEKIDEIHKKMNEIFPVVKEQIRREDAYNMVKADLKKGGNTLKWSISILLALGLASGYFQQFLKWFLAIK